LWDRVFVRRRGGKARKAKTSEDGSAFGQCPEGVVFAALDDTVYLVVEEAVKSERGYWSMGSADRWLKGMCLNWGLKMVLQDQVEPNKANTAR